jgi:predicted NUDIX family phosphoesterase
MTTPFIKHPQHIVCIPSSVVAHRVDGLVDYELNNTDLMLGQREVLENNDAFRQVLSIAIFTCKGKVWAYRRGAGIGESRLVGKVAVSVGGHWDLEDIVHNDSVIDLPASIKKGFERELSEEVNLTSKIVSEYVMDKKVCADVTPVDRKHLAMITVFELDDEGLSSKEKALESLGFIDPQELLDSDANLETWSTIACQQLIEKRDAEAL